MICKKQLKGADDLGRNLVVQLHIYIYIPKNGVRRPTMPRNLMMKIRASTMLRGRSSLYHHHSSDLLCTWPPISSYPELDYLYECDTIIPPVKKARDFVGL